MLGAAVGCSTALADTFGGVGLDVDGCGDFWPHKKTLSQHRLAATPVTTTRGGFFWQIFGNFTSERLQENGGPVEEPGRHFTPGCVRTAVGHESVELVAQRWR